MRIQMQAHAQDGVLASALTGQKVFAAMVADTAPTSEPEIAFLDFSGVSVATVSFLRECVVGYRNHARSHWNSIYPVVANLAGSIREDLELFLRDRGDAMAICDLDKAGRATNVQLVGRLDGKQDLTLRAVIEQGEIDATTLAERFKGEKAVSPTAWNNRLAALATKGLVIELSSGRSKRYRPVLEKLKYGT